MSDSAACDYTIEQPEKRAGFVALIGAANVGKSTLINCLTGAKISIVTHKAQTTRMVIRGIVIHNDSQIIFVDTPGIFKPRRGLDSMMIKTAWRDAVGADIVAVTVDAKRGLDFYTDEILLRISEQKYKAVLVINKIDLVEKDSLLSLAADLNAKASFDQTFMVSARTGDGVDSLLSYLSSVIPPGPWLYPQDQISDTPMRVLAAEITREKLFLRVHDEVPYALTVETTDWQVLRKGKHVRIEQIIHVMRDTQRKIVIGKGGSVIKSVGIAARHEIGSILDMPVHLFLSVKVQPKWADISRRLLSTRLDQAN